MVKGISKRVIVIKSPDKRIFEEAIFIMREDAFKTAGITAEDVVNEACKIASSYVTRTTAEKYKFIIPALCIGAGIAIAGIIWAITGVI